jgi:bifunctional non-homologous end joining protein LigD
MDEGHTDQLVFFAFDLLFLNGQSTAQLPLIERKERLKRLFKKEVQGLRYSNHVTGGGPRFREHACKLGLEGVISKRVDRPYAPGGTSAPCCWATTPKMDTCTTLVAQAPAWEQRS